MLLVRYYAGARAAAGASEEKHAAGTLAELLSVISAGRPTLAAVLPACSFLVDGLAWHDPRAPLADHTVVDVLPPFAGG